MAFVSLISRVNVAVIDVLQHLHDAGHRNNTFKGVKLHLFYRCKTLHLFRKGVAIYISCRQGVSKFLKHFTYI